MKWITRARPKIDRLACPWLIARFIDPEAEFIFVPGEEVMAKSLETGAIPFDVPGVELSHHGERCSFDAFLEHYNLTADPALQRLALIVRAADTCHPELAPQAQGLLAVSEGLRAIYPEDHPLLAQGIILYDALYAWCKESH